MPITDINKLEYSQCFKIVNGQIIPVNVFAKIVLDTKNNSKLFSKIDEID
ncbi:hypothetical protein [Acanthamoeba castellanii mimivirus]|uniref:Uncharacterized protein n=3 Tax=Mimivirus TaxID=315393 RepID=A0A0G2YAB8_MIMIV|nr:mg1105 protein [Hirudovirus strain Sangsue]AKI79641.1 hypothetical protein [Acanthamoeba polyphaga mimivirus]AMK62072.1 hypothetical protein [Samba virus]QTF49797.1 mg1105 protein [Mimivirus reunion]WMV62240.1 mg1105 protein [Mimivirus sp.]BAV61991.1 hypothetical protein [Acanthamoeba castellanii mimivirus]